MADAPQPQASLPPLASMPEDATASPVAASALPPLASMPTDAAAAASALPPLPQAAVAPAAELMGPQAPAVQQGVPAALEAPPPAVAVAPPDAVPLHAAPPTADELAQRTMASAQGYQELARQQETAANQQSRAIDAQARVQQDQAQAQLQAMQQNAHDQQVLLDQQAARNEAAAKAQAAAAAKVDEASAAAAAVPFDPDHYRKNMSTGQHVSTAIALILGGLGSGMTGGPNLAAQMLQKRIDADIDAQKMNYEKARNTVADRRTSYAMLRDAGLTDQQAQLGARQALAAKYQGQLAVIGQSYQGPAVNANRQLLQAHLAQNHADAQGKLMQSVQQASNDSWDRRVQLETLADKAAGRGAEAHNMYAPFLNHQAEMEQLTLPGHEGHAKTPEMYQKAVVGEQGYQGLIPLLDKLIAMRREYGHEVLDRGTKAEAEATATAAQMNAKNVDGLGALSGPDMELLASKIPQDVLDPFTSDAAMIARLEAAKRAARVSRDTGLRVAGYRPLHGAETGAGAGAAGDGDGVPGEQAVAH